MSVRIIFRGLILFRFPGQLPHPDRIVAQLINKPNLPSRPSKKGAKHPKDGHEHYHGAEIQILTGAGTGGERVPQVLEQYETIDINVIAGDPKVIVEPSFLEHVPELSTIIANGKTDAVRALSDVSPNRKLIQNTVTIDRGHVRVRNVVTWDEGGFPLRGPTGQPGRVPASHALLNFVGSSIRGHTASEFVVDIPDAAGVRLTTTPLPTTEKRRKKLTGDKKPTTKFNHRVRHGDVEILITNYEFQRETAVPWGLDFQWLFEAAGYGPVDLGPAGFGEFATFARAYNPKLFESEVKMLLESTTGDPNAAAGTFTIGRPFPYIASPESLMGLARLAPTDEESRPICIGAFKPGGP